MLHFGSMGNFCVYFLDGGWIPAEAMNCAGEVLSAKSCSSSTLGAAFCLNLAQIS